MKNALTIPHTMSTARLTLTSLSVYVIKFKLAIVENRHPSAIALPPFDFLFIFAGGKWRRLTWRFFATLTKKKKRRFGRCSKLNAAQFCLLTGDFTLAWWSLAVGDISFCLLCYYQMKLWVWNDLKSKAYCAEIWLESFHFGIEPSNCRYIYNTIENSMSWNLTKIFQS